MSFNRSFHILLVRIIYPIQFKVLLKINQHHQFLIQVFVYFFSNGLQINQNFNFFFARFVTETKQFTKLFSMKFYFDQKIGKKIELLDPNVKLKNHEFISNITISQNLLIHFFTHFSHYNLFYGWTRNYLNHANIHK